MSSPLGHTLAGLSIYEEYRSRIFLGKSTRTMEMAAISLVLIAANLPDFDLLIPQGMLFSHRAVTHSLFFAVITGLAGAVIFRRVFRPRSIGFVLGLAVLSHIVIDFFSVDYGAPYGIALLWPFSDTYTISPFAVFPGVRREYDLLLGRTNRYALIFEGIFFGTLYILIRTCSRRESKRNESISSNTDIQ